MITNKQVVDTSNVKSVKEDNIVITRGGRGREPFFPKSVKVAVSDDYVRVTVGSKIAGYIGLEPGTKFDYLVDDELLVLRPNGSDYTIQPSENGNFVTLRFPAKMTAYEGRLIAAEEREFIVQPYRGENGDMPDELVLRW